MRLSDCKVGTWLQLSLAVILLSVALIGALAWVQSNRLWQISRDLYDHPMTTRRALGNLRADVLTVHVGMEELLRTQDPARQLAIQQSIDKADADAESQFAILENSYMGPHSDFEAALDAFIRWKAIRAETTRLQHAGRTGEAAARLDPTGANDLQAARIDRIIERISDFAHRKSSDFMAAAESTRQTLRVQLIATLTALLLLGTALGVALLRSIRNPLRELTNVADLFRRGNLDARCRYTAANELGALATTVNAMAETLQAQLKNHENVGRLADAMLVEDDLRSFSRSVLTALLELTGSPIGALYLLNDSGTEFQLYDSIGLQAGAARSFSALHCEGELGTALATRRLTRLTEIPADTRFALASTTGTYLPREVVTIPIVNGEEVVAVISLASLKRYDEAALRLLTDTWPVLTARLNGVLAARRLRELSARLENQNRELQGQSRELASQADELREQNAELELQKRQLDEANRLKGVFLSTMSHELRTPLNSVNALAGVLIRRLAGAIPPEEHGYLEVIQRNGKHLLALINDILDLSRIEAGRDELTLTRFAVSELAGSVVAMIDPQAREKSLPLKTRIEADLPPLVSDFAKCSHILQNLVGNAVKFTDQGSVELTARQVGDEILIAVTDTGIGIAEEFIPHLFDEFRQADDGLSRKYGGTGLGLAIARRYATMLRGRITVVSSPGHGSTFTLALPAALAGAIAPPPPAEAAPPPSPPATAGGGSLLLVEDSEPVVVQITDVLAGHGYRIRVARDGREAIAQVDEALPDAMILDLMMPNVDGFQVLQTLRSQERTVRLPVIILTAKHLTPDDLAVLKSNHIEQVIQKGDVNKAELLAAVARMLAPPARPRPVQVNPPTPPGVDDLKATQGVP